MTTRLPWSGRTLYCMTHPDDELFVCAAMRRQVDAGEEVWVSWTHSTDRRATESRMAMRLLGIPPDRLRFLGAPDGEVGAHLLSLQETFRALFEAVRPEHVVCGAFEQGHLDHDATHWLVRSAFDGPVWESPFYHVYTRDLQTMCQFSDPTGSFRLDLGPAERRLKEQMLRQFPSQNIWSVLKGYALYRLLTLRPAPYGRWEFYRPVQAVDYTVPAHPDPLRSRVARSEAWHRWLGWLRAVRSGS